jgi:hypothetical protein
LVNLKTKSSGDDYPKKAIKKTVLRFLGSHTFSHGLDPKRKSRVNKSVAPVRMILGEAGGLPMALLGDLGLPLPHQ